MRREAAWVTLFGGLDIYTYRDPGSSHLGVGEWQEARRKLGCARARTRGCNMSRLQDEDWRMVPTLRPTPPCVVWVWASVA